MLELRSSNPVLADQQLASVSHAGAVMEPATIGGVVQKTTVALTIAVVGGIGGAALTNAFGGSAQIGLLIASLVVSLGCYFIVYRHPERAAVATPIYAAVQGAMLGSFAIVLDAILASRGITALGGLGLQAFVITLAVTGAMLLVYRAGLIRPGKTFVAVISTLTLGVCLLYLAAFVLGFFGIQIPGLSLSSAFEGGKMAWVGLGINAAILILASLWLIIDFGQVEAAVRSGARKNLEWYLVFGLMVTLVWIYLEALKLAFRAALLANSRK